MTRARRIHQGEATQSVVEVDTIYDGEDVVGFVAAKAAPATDEPREPGVELGPEAKRFCKRCEAAADNVAIMVSRSGKPIQVAAEQHVVVAHTGTVHLDAGEGMTLCGLEHSDW